MIDEILVWLLLFALLYLLVTSVVLLRNRFDFTPLVQNSADDKNDLKISVCIPARNEESTIGTLLDSLLNQNRQNYDIHVLDDQSEDNTQSILQSYKEKNPELLYVHSGKPKPDNWLGKPWACNQLGELSDGEIVVFLDADTTLQPDALSGIASSFKKYRLDMLTVWPKQKLMTFWEKTVIPLIYYSLLTLLPAIYVYRSPRWMPGFLKKYFDPKFAAACGQCIAFKRKSYEQIGGHKSVKKKVVEDVELAKIVKKRGLTMRMFNGMGTISCRMYENQREMLQGLRKNFLAGFGHSIPLFLSAALLHLVVFVLPFITIITSFISGNIVLFYLSVASVTIILLHRLILSIWFRWDPIFSFTHPLGVLWFQRLGLIKLSDFFTGRSSTWKGRKV